MNDIPTITQGCDFTIRISAKRLGINRYVKVSFEEIANISVNLVCLPAIKTPVSCSIDEDGRLLIPISGESLVCNSYGIELLGFYNNGNWRHQIAPAFEIVRTSTEDNYALTESDDLTIDMSIVIGETYTSSRALIGAIDDHNTNPDAHQDIKQAITAAQQAIAIAQQLIEDAQEEIADLQEGLQNAGKVDDVKVDGVSIVDGNKIAQINSDNFGKVDDVKVNNESVVDNQKTANITIPTKVSDLVNDVPYPTRTEAQAMADANRIDNVVVNIEESNDVPIATGSIENGTLTINMSGIKGDPGEPGLQGEQGEKGDPGDSAVFDPDTGNVLAVLESTTGQSTTNAMTQKAVTDELNKNANKIWTNLEISWNANDKYYNDSGNLVATSGYNNAVVDVTDYQGKSIIIYVYMGAVVCSLFKDINGNKITGAIKKSLSSGTWSTTVPANATTLCLSNSRSKVASPYVRVHTSNKLAIEVANEIASTISGLQTIVENVNVSSPSDVYPAMIFTRKQGYHIPNATGIETANRSYRIFKGIPVSIIKSTITTNAANCNGFHCYDAEGNWLGLVSKGVSVAGLPEGTTELRISTTTPTPTITCAVPAKKAMERLINERNNFHVISTILKVGNVSPDSTTPELNGSYAITDYIPVYGGMGVEIPNGKDTNAICFYNSSLNYIGGTCGYAAKAPSGAAYFVARVGANTLAGNKFNIVLHGVEGPGLSVTAEIERKMFMLESYLKGKKLGIIGDSITAASFQGHWVRLICQMTGATAKNVAIAGQKYANGEMASQAANLDGNESLVIIFAGTNDFNTGGGSTLGSPYIITDGQKTAPTGNSTAAGVHQVINAIYDKCGYVPIVIMTPLPRPGQGDNAKSSWQQNSKGLFLDDYVDVIKKVAQMYAVPVLDLHNDINLPAPLLGQGTYYADGVHPLINVHGMIAKMLYKFLMEKMVRW